MKALLKWSGIALGVVLVLIVGAVVLVPRFVDVQQYKPQIEQLVSEKTGRSFAMGDDIHLSVFPWVGISLGDLVLGNATGYTAPQMVSVKQFEVRLKVMPLLSKQWMVDTFVIDSPHFYLEKDKKGKGNWENIGPVKSGDAEKKAKKESKDAGALPIESLMVKQFSILNGLVSYVDQAASVDKQVTDFNLVIDDVSLDNPVKIDLGAKLDGKPIALVGTVGPIGKEPGKGEMTVDIVLKALDQIEAAVKGRVVNPAGGGNINLNVDVAPFSPKQVFQALGLSFPIQSKDPSVLEKVAVKAKVNGTMKGVAVTDGLLLLDDTTTTFSAAAKAFHKPDLKFDLAVDQIDLDRYLPPAQEGKKEKVVKQPAGEKKSIDYGPLRKMVLDGKATIGKLKVANMKFADVLAHITAQGGVIKLDPFSMNLYQGSLASTTRVDVRKNVPRTKVNLTLDNVQAGPMIQDAAGKDIIEGTLAAAVNLNMAGDKPKRIKQTLGGSGELTFLDGAVVGIDIAGTVRNVTSGFGKGTQTTEKPKTDFAELKIPFTAQKGLVSVPGASLTSPLLRLTAKGKTSLPKETLDFRLNPKLVATLKGQGDTKDRSGLAVPLLVTGTYAEPKIRPDMEGMMKETLSNPEGIKQLLDSKSGTKGSKGTPEDAVKGVLKGFMNK